MKRLHIYSLLLSVALFSCTEEKKIIVVTVENPTAENRPNEMIEISLDGIEELSVTDTFVILNNEKEQIPYQITHDKKVIASVSLQPNETINYVIEKGIPDVYKTISYGKQYPERVDDIAWENDRIAFRTYGPALQASGEKAFGYDVWVKCVSELVVEERYKKELNEGISYHIDHGNGLDYYKVGPTLGAGTSALIENDSLVYPYCYKTYEILDNGPLRFTVKLTYNPLVISTDSNVVETRIISLDVGSQLNKIAISYTGLSKPTSLATGIVLHTLSDDCQIDATNGYIAYAEPIELNDGQTFVGAVFPSKLAKAETVYFDEEEKNARGAEGHIVAMSNYEPNTTYIYYAGAGWSKWGFENSNEWYRYIRNFSNNIVRPLRVKTSVNTIKVQR